MERQLMNRIKVEFMLFLVVLIWGANYTIGKFGVSSLSPQWFTLLRFVIVAPILLMMTRWKEKEWGIPKAYWGRVIMSGIVGITLYQTTFMLSVKYSSATDAALLISLSPIFTAILGPIFGYDRLSIRGFAGVIIAFVGGIMVLLLGSGGVDTTNYALIGNIAGIVAAFFWGLYPLIASPLVRVYSSLRVTAWSSVAGVFGLVLVNLVIPDPINLHISLSAWMSILYAAIPVTLFGLVTWYDGISKLGAHSVMIYMYSIPVAAMVTAYFVIHEPIRAGQVIGAAVILAGTVLLKSQPTRPNTVKEKRFSPPME